MASSTRKQESSAESGQGFDFPAIRVPNMMLQRMGNTQGLGILSEGIPSPFQMVEEGAHFIGAGLPYSMNPGSAKNLTFFTKHLQAPCFPPKPPRIQPGEYETEIPQKNDVLMGRGSRINNHEGNIQFREHVSKYKVQYLDKNTKKVAKAHICANIVDWVRGLDPPGRFLQKSTDTGKWVEIGDERARKKAGQALREDTTATKKEKNEKSDNFESSMNLSNVNSSSDVSNMANVNSSNNLSSFGASSFGASNLSSATSPDSFYTATSSMATVPASNTGMLDSTRSEYPVYFSATSQILQSPGDTNQLTLRNNMAASVATSGTTSPESSRVFGLSHTSTDEGNERRADSLHHNVDEEISHIEMDIKRMNDQLHQQQLFLKQQQDLSRKTQEQQYLQQQQQQNHHQYMQQQQNDQQYMQQQQNDQQYTQGQQQQDHELGFDIEPIPLHSNASLPLNSPIKSIPMKSDIYSSLNSPQSVVEDKNGINGSGASEIQNQISPQEQPDLSLFSTEDEGDMLRGSVMSWNNGAISSSMMKRSSVASRGRRRSSVVSNSIRRSMTIHRSRVGRARAESFDMQDMMMSITSLGDNYDPSWFDLGNSMQMSFIGSIGEGDFDNEELKE